jgi:hypothetical protein
VIAALLRCALQAGGIAARASPGPCHGGDPDAGPRCAAADHGAVARSRAPIVTGRPTYGDLVGEACGDVARAAVVLAVGRLSGRIAAREAVAAYQALFGAIHAHVNALCIHANRLDVVAASSPGEPRDASAAELVHGLTAFGYLPGLLRYTAEGPGTARGAATTSMLAATDLLATYRILDGVLCTAGSLQQQDLAHRTSALDGIGDLTSMVLEVEPELTQRAGQAGMAHEDLERLLPDLSPLRRTVLALTERS